MQPERTNVWRRHWCRADTGVERRLPWTVKVAEFSRYFAPNRPVSVRMRHRISVVTHRLHIAATSYWLNTASRCWRTRHYAFELTACLTQAGREITPCNYINCSVCLRRHQVSRPLYCFLWKDPCRIWDMIHHVTKKGRIPAANKWCGRSLTGIAGSNPAGSMDICLLWVLCVLSGRGLCDRPIPRPDESYRVWCLSVISKPQRWPTTSVDPRNKNGVCWRCKWKWWDYAR